MKRFCTFFFVLLFISSSILKAIAGAPTISPKPLRLSAPMGFIENKGQFFDQNLKERSDLLYMLQREGMKVQLMQNRISFELYTTQDANNAVDEAKGLPYYNQLDPEDRPTPRLTYLSSRVDVEFIGANPHPEIIAEQQMKDYLNYYLTYAPKKQVTRVAQYNKITYKNLYNNIDLVLIATPDQNPEQSLVYDFIVHPGGNLKDIKYRYHGTQGQTLTADGSIQTSTKQGQMIEMIPQSYLKNEDGSKLAPVNVSFKIDKNVIGFTSSNYDRKQSLVIDPALIWKTYCGGDSSEEGRGLTTDSMGNVALIGRSNSTNNIASVGAYQETLAGNVDIILEKYTQDGLRVWGTYYGGINDDHGRGLVADKLNNYYLGCHGNSDGMATPGAYREHYAGGFGDDGLLAYFSSDGFLKIATYYGGTGDETIRRLCIDHDNNVIMCGYTFSDTGIATPGVYQTVWAGNADLCLSKWTPDCRLIWGSYLGGTEEDHGRSVTIDKDDNIYVNGSTASEGIATPGVSRTHLADKQDYLLGSFTKDGQIRWVSYWGGAVEDRGRGVFVDSSSHYVYFTGYSASDTGVATPGAYQEHWYAGIDANGDPYHDMVVMKWTLDGHIKWATYLGGAFDDRGRAITMIGDNEIYISGSTESPDSMATSDAFQPKWGGRGDMFLEIWDSTGYRKYGSYMGGNGDDDNLALAIDDKHQNIYLVGTSGTQNFATPGTQQTVYGGDDDAFLVRIQVHTPSVPPVALFNYLNIPCSHGTVAFTNTSLNADSYFWRFGDGSTSTVISPEHTYSGDGNYKVSLVSTNSALGLSDTFNLKISVVDTTASATITPLGSTTFCEGGSVVLSANTGPGYSYKWKDGNSFIDGATDPTYTADTSGDYKVIVTVSEGCSATSLITTVTVNPNPIVNLGSDTTICTTATLTLDAGSGYNSYLWSTGETTQTIVVATTNDYWAQVTDSNTCTGRDTIHVESAVCEGIGGIANASSINLYPNPASGNFILSFSNPGQQSVKVQLENVLGQVVKNIYEGTTGASFTKTISTHNLTPGMYYVKVSLGDKTSSRKLIIQ